MKKLLPCSLLKRLLPFLVVAFFATFTAVAQEPANCNVMETFPPRSCVGVTSIYGARVNASGNGLTIRWTFVTNQTGAFFTDAGGANLGIEITRTAVGSDPDGTLNNVLVNVGSSAGSLTVKMEFLNPDGTVNPLGSCSSSRLVRAVRVVLNEPVLSCPQDVATLIATATTQTAAGGLYTASPPYLYTLMPGNIQNGDGIFAGLGAGTYTVTAREVLLGGGLGCEATATRTIAAVPASPIVLDCADNVERNSCTFVDQAAVNTAFQAWLDDFSYTGGFSPVVEVFEPAVPTAPLLCGGVTTVRYIVTDRCLQRQECTRTFRVLAPPAVNPLIPGNREVAACDIADLAALAALVNAYSAEFSAGGGCAPRVELDPYVLPNLCGGVLNITGRIIDRCDVVIPIARTFTILPATTPTILCAGPKTIACDAAFVFDPPTPGGDCGPLVVNIVSTTVSEDGLSSTRTWDVTNRCGIHSVTCSQTITRIPCVEPNGCTLGYWKTHTQAWDCYTTCTLYNTVFTGSTLNPNLTLLQALNLGGGGCNNLARQSVAALLNICDGTLDYSVANIADLQALVNAAFANGTCGAAGSLLDGYNNEGGANHCDVVKSPNTSAPTPGCVNGGRSELPKGGTKVTPHPNPFRGNVTFDITPVETGLGSFTVFNLMGQQVGKTYENVMTAGVTQEIQLQLPSGNHTFIYKLTLNGVETIGKIVGKE